MSEDREEYNYNNDSEYTSNKEKCCLNCKHFDERTHFCRLNPPIPMLFYTVDRNGNKMQNVSSKFPVITFPSQDYCSHFALLMIND